MRTEADLAFQEAQIAGTMITQPSKNRCMAVAATVTPSIGTTGRTLMKPPPRTNPSPTLCKPTNATAAQTIRFGSSWTKGPSKMSQATPAPTAKPTNDKAVAIAASPNREWLKRTNDIACDRPRNPMTPVRKPQVASRCRRTNRSTL